MTRLILIPGLLCNRLLWSSQIAGLQGRAEISVADITEQPTIEGMAAGVLQRAPERFALAGFSLGSQVALEMMQVAGSRIKRLALLSATHGGLLPAVATAIQRAIGVIECGGFDEYLETAYPTYFAASHAEDGALKRAFLEMAHAIGAEAGLRQMRALLAVHKPFMNLNQIHCPTLIIGGREDHRTTPEAHALLAQEIPGSKLAMVDGAAHFTPLEQPDQVTSLLEHWLISRDASMD
jgi:pimeloyl-ACP methyl ester carboxylesterase